MLVDKQLPSLVGGVSQQPATVRLASQAEENTNAWLSVSYGAQKRPPAFHVAQLTTDQLDDAYLHTINRDVAERYTVIFDGTTIRVFDMTGDEKNVRASAAESLATFFASNGLNVSIGETFFVVDSQDTDDDALATAKGSAPVAGDAFKRTGAAAVVFVSSGASMTTALASVALVVSGADLTAFFAGAGAGVANPGLFKGDGGDTVDTAFATAKGSAPAVNDIWKRTGAATIIFVGSTADLTAAQAAPLDLSSFAYVVTSNPRENIQCVTVADYTFVLNRGFIVRLMDTDGEVGGSTDPQPVHHWTMIPRYPGEQSDDTAPFSAGGFRGQRARQNQYSANPSGGTLQGTVQTFQDLPTGATSGDIYLIKGSADSAFANYYVRSAGDNVWNETVAPGLRNRIDATTMPHALVRKANGSFSFGPFSWADRKVGDETTNPNPTFVSREIRDLFWYKNRFGVAVDEGISLTRVGDFGNFYRLTVVDVLNDDRVDVQASETKVTKINFAVPFDGSIMLFSDQTQLRLSHGSDGLTPSNCTLDPVTNYKMIPNVRPFALGSDVYFAQDNGDFATIREYFVAPDSQVNDAANITGHVPRYVPSDINRITGSDSHDFLMVLPGSSGDGVFTASNEMFVYQFHWVSETEKAQSAWHKWTFSSESGILSAEVLDNQIIMIVVRDDGTYLDAVELPTAAATSSANLDRAAGASTLGYSVPLDRTTWSLVYPVTGTDRDNFMLVRDTDGRMLTDDPADWIWVSDTVVGLAGSHVVNAISGLLYEWRYEFSEQFARNSQEVPMLNGTLLLREWTVSFVGTATFEIDVRPYGVATTTERVVPARIASGGNLTVGLSHFVTTAPVFSDGKHSFGVYGDSTDAIVALVDRSPYSLTFTQAEYEAFFHKRSRTI